jgi:hypothetical protein
MARAACGSVDLRSCSGVGTAAVGHHLTAATAAGAERSEETQRP